MYISYLMYVNALSLLSQHAPGQLWLPMYDHPASLERRCRLVHRVSQE